MSNIPEEYIILIGKVFRQGTKSWQRLTCSSLSGQHTLLSLGWPHWRSCTTWMRFVLQGESLSSSLTSSNKENTDGHETSGRHSWGNMQNIESLQDSVMVNLVFPTLIQSFREGEGEDWYQPAQGRQNEAHYRLYLELILKSLVL